jgi:putative transposase
MPQIVASEINLSAQQKHLLERIARAHSNPYRLVQRAQIILWAAEGKTNTEIGTQQKLSRGQVRLWRNRWLVASESLTTAQKEGMDEKELEQKIITLLADQPRSGNPGKFSIEQIVEIVALACELPQTSERPVSHWTPKELAQEAVTRGIVEGISPRSVGRFLKSGTTKTTSPSLLVKCKS